MNDSFFNKSSRTVPRSPISSVESPTKKSLVPSRSPSKSPVRKPLTTILLQDIGLRQDLFGARNDPNLKAKTTNWLSECVESSKKRGRENDSLDDSRDIRRRRIEHCVVKEQQRPKALPLEIWYQITCGLDLKDLGFFSLACRHFSDMTYDFIFTSTFWGDKLEHEFKEQALRGNVLESRRVLHLIDRSSKSLTKSSSERSFKSFVDPLYPCMECDSLNNSLEPLNYPSCNDLVSFSRKRLTAYAVFYHDQHDFLLNILLGEKVNAPSFQDKRMHLNTVKLMCDRSIIILNDDKVLFHARKIIEYFIKNGNFNSLHYKAVKLLFVGLQRAMLEGDSEDINHWIHLLDSSFEYLDDKGVYSWFTESVRLLKKSGNTPLESENLEEPKKQILKLIESHLLAYLNLSRNYTLLLLLEALNHRYVSREISIEIEKILKSVCVQNNPKFVHGLMQAIVNNYKRLKSISTQSASCRIIRFAISQHGYEIVMILLRSIGEMLNHCDDRFKEGLRHIIIETYNLSDFWMRAIIVNAILGFTFNRLLIEPEFYIKLRSLVQTKF